MTSHINPTRLHSGKPVPVVSYGMYWNSNVHTDAHLRKALHYDNCRIEQNSSERVDVSPVPMTLKCFASITECRNHDTQGPLLNVLSVELCCHNLSRHNSSNSSISIRLNTTLVPSRTTQTVGMDVTHIKNELTAFAERAYLASPRIYDAWLLCSHYFLHEFTKRRGLSSAKSDPNPNSVMQLTICNVQYYEYYAMLRSASP